MRLGILGAYESGLLCDDLLYMAVSRAINKLKPDWIVFPFPAQRQEADAYLVAGGTILGTPLTGLPHDKPFAVFGAGYRGSEHIECLHKAISVKVRGSLTCERLREHGIDAVPCGDPIALLNIPSNIGIYRLGLVPRAIGWAKSPLELKQWLYEKQPDIVIAMNTREDDCNGIAWPKVVHPQTATEALQLILSCKALATARLHPYLIALKAGIPAIYYEVEFNKGEDAISGITQWANIWDSLRDTLDLLEEWHA